MDPIKTQAPQETKLHFLDYWRIIRIRKTVILAVFLLVVITATLVTFILPEAFASSTRIKVDRDIPDVSGFAERSPGNAYDPYFIQTEFETISSEKVLLKVVEDPQLDLRKSWGEKYIGPGETMKPERCVDILKRSMDLRPVRNTSFIEIKYYSEKPEEAAKLANAIAKAYKGFREEQRLALSKSGIKAVEDRLKEQEEKVKTAQKELERLREELQVPDTMAMQNSPVLLMSAESLHRLEGLRIETQAEF